MSCLFETIVGARAFTALPAPLQRLHAEARGWHGVANVVRGGNWLARAICALMRLPPERKDVPVTVTIDADAAGEWWTRQFDTHRMRSRLWARAGTLRERLRPMTFDFQLHASESGIVWQLCAARALGIPLPLAWFGAVAAREFEFEGRYCFAVAAALPLVGLLVRYEGWLDVG